MRTVTAPSHVDSALDLARPGDVIEVDRPLDLTLRLSWTSVWAQHPAEPTIGVVSSTALVKPDPRRVVVAIPQR